MIDDHSFPSDWGVRPILFHLSGFDVPAYPFFVTVGLVVGLSIYAYESRRKRSLNENGIFIAVGSLTGGILGAKLLELVLNYKIVVANIADPGIWLSGRTIVGGLIGGTIGAMLTKRVLGIKERRGNLFAPAVAMGVAIGRMGSFFRGCCYGKPTVLPWGVDFGDGIARHPTQLYESLFMLVMFTYLERVKDREDVRPGQLFKTLMVSYFIFRFLVEFIRVEPVVFVGMTSFQIISVGVILYLVRQDVPKFFRKLNTYVGK
jgi:phosphatidylglycerol---prolipoprotein diacylglyceryl transferase